MSMDALRWARSARGITAAQKVVLLLLADMANDAAECWPGLTSLAADGCISERCARDSLRALESAGLVESIPGGGRHRTNLYRLRLNNTETRQPVPPFAHQETRQMTTQTRQMTTETRQPFPETRQPLPPNPKNPQEPSRTLKDNAREREAFNDFWAAYPRKVGKGAAETAFAKARARGATVADIAHGLNRQTWPDDPRFIPHPATWLNQRRWQDDPHAAAPPAPTQPGKLDWLWNTPDDHQSAELTPTLTPRGLIQ
jgi:hypothetical protein